MAGGYLQKFEKSALRAMSTSPRYFVRWYTIKSISLVVAIGAAAYFAGKANGSRKWKAA